MKSDDGKKRGPRGPYCKRYWRVDKVTGKRFRAASPFALYSNDANQQFAKRQRRKQRKRAAEERNRETQRRIDEVIEDRRRQEQQAQREAERARKNDEALQMERERALRERQLAQARATDVQARFNPCECGCSIFEVIYKRVHHWLRGDSDYIWLECAKCHHQSKQVITPGSCPNPLCRDYKYWFDVRTGDLKCQTCKSSRRWGEFQIG